MKLNTTKANTIATTCGFLSLTLLVLLSALLVAPVIPKETNATTANSDVGVTIEGSAIAIISPPSTISTTVSGDNFNSITTSTANITVATNNVTGYTLSVSAASDSTTALVKSDDATKTIPTLTSDDVAAADFPVNYWGFSTDSGATYDGLKTTSTTLKETVARSSSDTTTITIGTKVNRDTVAGTYTNTLTFSAVANAVGLEDAFAAYGKSKVTVGGNSYYKMQDMSKTICNAVNVLEETNVALVDTRDNKLYYVSKLEDDNCWMTQNLDYVLSSSTTLTPSTSNVSTNWTPERSTISFTGTSVSDWSNDYNNPYSARFNGTDGNSGYIISSGSTDNDTTYDTLAACTAAGNSEATCQHGSRGVYYNWSAAVASNDTSGSTTQYTQMSDSVCPAGWKLPKGNDSSGNGDFKALNTAYGITSNAAGSQTLRSSPLSFARSGYVGNTSLDGLASHGYYWSSTVYSSSSACNLYFFSSNVSPQDLSSRYYGFSVRCVAQ